MGVTDEQINAAQTISWECTKWSRHRHEAEKTLTYKHLQYYLMELLDFIDEPILASARQRAEAFLRTLGKWEEVQG